MTTNEIRPPRDEESEYLCRACPVSSMPDAWMVECTTCGRWTEEGAAPCVGQGRTVTTYEVICEDGERRHEAPFATRREADLWAWWGHVCLARHEVRPINNTHNTEETS